MSSQSIGVLRGAISGRVYATINPDDDGQLDNPRLLLIQNEEQEPVAVIRIARAEYMACQSMAEVAVIVEREAKH